MSTLSKCTWVIVGAVLLPAAATAQTAAAIAGQGTAAMVSTAGVNQQIANAALPNDGGLANASIDAVNLAGTIVADGLATFTTGMMDLGTSSAQTTAEAANVNLLNGLIVARQVVAVASSYVSDAGTAASDGDGSTLLGLRIAGTDFGDVTPAPNTRVELPGVGYAILNEQSQTGDGATTSGITVNMIHVVLLNSLTGLRAGEIIVGSAQSAVGS